MSLDFYLRSSRPVRHRGTGVFIRKDGCTRELETIEEVKAHFPDADLSEIHIQDYTDNVLMSFNLTHNLTTMAAHVPIEGTDGKFALPRFDDDPKDKPLSAYNLLWHPETNPLLKQSKVHVDADECQEEHDVDVTLLDAEFVRQLMSVQHYIATHEKELRKYDPSNGWGDYSQLNSAATSLLRCILDIPTDDLNQYYIYCWT